MQQILMLACISYIFSSSSEIKPLYISDFLMQFDVFHVWKYPTVLQDLEGSEHTVDLIVTVYLWAHAKYYSVLLLNTM